MEWLAKHPVNVLAGLIPAFITIWSTIKSSSVWITVGGFALVAAVAVPFLPRTFHVPVGGSVTWINKDTMAHTVTSNTTGLFDSGYLTTGASWSHTFATPGTFEYHCIPHQQMWGVIIVG